MRWPVQSSVVSDKQTEGQVDTHTCMHVTVCTCTCRSQWQGGAA